MQNNELCILFGLKLKKFREKNNLSQEKFAQIADLDRTYISSVERGKRNISLINIFKLAHALNIDPCNLINFQTNNHSLEE